MPKTKTPPELAPSSVHQRLLKTQKPSHSFQGGDVKAWQRKLRPKIRACLGDWPEKRPALRPRSLWKGEHSLGRIEKILFTSEPGADVPAYVCIPKDAQPPYAWLICLQGHSSGMHHSIGVQYGAEDKPLRTEGDHDFALQAMAHGMAALCIEQRGFGERREMPTDQNTTCRDAALHALQFGRSLVGERVYDVDRGIDYLASRGDCDMKRVGLLGLSGGGATTMFAAAVLPRLRFAVPAGYFCTFRASIMSINHCICNYVPGALKYGEMADILGLFAPRPVVVVTGEQDDIFPVGPTRSEFKRLRAIYHAAGAPDNCRLVVGPGGHRFYADQAWPAMLQQIETTR